MGLSHTQARVIADRAFEREMGRAPTLAESQTVRMISLCESGYGAGWKGIEGETHNWGAVQAGKAPCDPTTSFEYTDTHPNADGSSTPYTICFRRYDSHEDGAAHVVRLLFTSKRALKAGTPAAAASGNVFELASAQYHQGYYEGRGKTVEERIARHARTISACLDRIVAETGEERAGGPPPWETEDESGSTGWGVGLALGAALIGYALISSRRK